MGRNSVALAACWGWVLLGQLAPVLSAAGAEPTVPAPQRAAEPEAAAQPLEPIPAEASQPTQPLEPIPAGEGHPAQSLAPARAEQESPQSPPPEFQPATSELHPNREPTLPARRAPPSGFRPPTSATTSAPREVPSDPAELVARALSLPADGTLAGRPIRLEDLLARTLDRRQREELITAYWHLAGAVAEHSFCRDYQTQLGRRQARLNPAALPAATAARWNAAAALAQARRGAAEAALVERQYALAALARLGPGEPLPLPADRPYVGAYRTYFRELFPGGVGPGRTRLIDRALPLVGRAIEHYAAAVEAADEALAAAGRPEGAQAAIAVDALQLLERRYRQQRALIEAVVAYNQQIAEYALAVAPPGIEAGKLVSMLIKSEPAVAQPSPPAAPSSVRPAVAEEQIPVPGRPTRAVPPPGSSLPEEGLPEQPGEALPPSAGSQPDGGSSPAGGSPSDPGSPSGDALPPAETPPPGGALPEATGMSPERQPAQASPGRVLPQGPVVPVNPSAQPPTEPAEATLHKPIEPVEEPADGEPEAVEPLVGAPEVGWPGLERSEAPDAGSSEVGERKSDVGGSHTFSPAVEQAALILPALYGALGQVAPEQQAEQLAALLNWDRVLSGKGQPVDLLSCLKAAGPGERLAMVESFWQVRRRAAEYQLLAESLPWFDDLGLVVQAGGVQTEPAVLRQARQHAAGAARAAEARLLDAQYDLAVRLGQANDWPWPLPSTLPHAGEYSVLLDSLPSELAASWSVRGLAETIARSHRRLARQAAAVVAADQARAAAVAECSSGEGGVAAAVETPSGQPRLLTAVESPSDTDWLLAAVEAMELQVQATEQFLEALTDYNTAIAQYALMTLPPQTPAERVLRALVVEP